MIISLWWDIVTTNWGLLCGLQSSHAHSVIIESTEIFLTQCVDYGPWLVAANVTKLNYAGRWYDLNHTFLIVHFEKTRNQEGDPGWTQLGTLHILFHSLSYFESRLCIFWGSAGPQGYLSHSRVSREWFQSVYVGKGAWSLLTDLLLNRHILFQGCMNGKQMNSTSFGKGIAAECLFSVKYTESEFTAHPRTVM